MRASRGRSPLRDAALKVRALSMLAAARGALAMARWTTVRRLLRPRRPAAPLPAPRIARAVAAMARRLPGTTCLARSIVAESLLKRHGHDARLQLGVRRGARGLEAHAWVACPGLPADRGDFTELA